MALSKRDWLLPKLNVVGSNPITRFLERRRIISLSLARSSIYGIVVCPILGNANPVILALTSTISHCFAHQLLVYLLGVGAGT